MAHHRSLFSLEELGTPAALLDVFGCVERCLKRGNTAGAALQLVRVTQALAARPALFGLEQTATAGADAAAAWAAAGGAAVCADPCAFPTALFDKWLSVLQQAGDRMPYKAENWSTVLGVVTEARHKLEGSGLSCDASAAAVERHVSARLAACRIQEAAERAPAAAVPAAAPAAGARSQATPGGAATLQQVAAGTSAGGGTGGRSRRRAAVAAQAAIVAAVESGAGAEEEAAAGTAGGRQQQVPGSSDQENVAAGSAVARGPASKPTAKRISSLAAPPAVALGQKQALQPAAGQPAAGAAKRARQ